MSIVPMLWFDQEARDAAQLYVTVFGGEFLGETTQPTYYIAEISVRGQRLSLMNAGPHHEFNDAISLQVLVDTQEEIDDLTNQLTSAGGEVIQCGWVNDPWGVRWQIVPKRWIEMVQSGDAAAMARVTEAFMAMKVINLAELERAFAS